MTEREQEIERLEAKLAASRGQPGYRDRVKEIERVLAELRGDG